MRSSLLKLLKSFIENKKEILVYHVYHVNIFFYIFSLNCKKSWTSFQKARRFFNYFKSSSIFIFGEQWQKRIIFSRNFNTNYCTCKLARKQRNFLITKNFKSIVHNSHFDFKIFLFPFDRFNLWKVLLVIVIENFDRSSLFSLPFFNYRRFR